MNTSLAGIEILQLNTKNSPSRGLFLEGEGSVSLQLCIITLGRTQVHIGARRRVKRVVAARLSA